MGIYILVVVAVWQGAKLLAETIAAGVVTAGRAVAISAPIAERFCDHLQLWVIGEHGATLTHGDMVRRVEAKSGDVTPGTNHPSVKCGP